VALQAPYDACLRRRGHRVVRESLLRGVEALSRRAS
jgi:hypothetical protein